jgi:nicotinamidase-related amidase
VSGSALLVMDVQSMIVDRFADDAYLDRLAETVAAARSTDVPVIYAVVEFRPGFPEVSVRNKIFSGVVARGGGAFQENPIHPAVAPTDGDVVVVKRRVSAFTGSDLDVVLRAREIDHLVLTGIATSGVVLSTLRQAADMDYAITVLSDGCRDADPEVHRVLTEKVFPAQAEVTTSAAWTGR